MLFLTCITAPDVRTLPLPLPPYSTITWSNTEFALVAPKLIPFQKPTVGDAVFAVKRIGESDVPTAFNVPVVEMVIPVPELNFTMVPGWIVKVIPAAIVTSQVTT